MEDSDRENKGEWAETADEGIVPAELGGTDAPPEMQDDDPELESEVLGRTTGSEEPATEEGVDLDAGDDADATADGGPDMEPERSPTSRMPASRPPTTTPDPARLITHASAPW